MRFDLDQVFGLNQQALLVRSKRAELIASNIANADTPNFKARDIDFRKALTEANSEYGSSETRTTHPSHIATGIGIKGHSTELLYRRPMQPSIDGNTVDTQIEKAAFAENAVQYQISLQFLSGRIKSIKSALKGE